MSETKRKIRGLFEGVEFLQTGAVAEVLGVTRQTAHRHLRDLVKEGFVIREGAGRGTRYRPARPTDERRYATHGLEEDRVWIEMSGPGSIVDGLPDRARSILQYILTELVNNAVDHSNASEVSVRLSRCGKTITLEVRDEGIGIFRHVRDRLDLESEVEALQELSKGKLTTMPSRHTGEGIFFTSKAVQRFEIESGGLRWIVDNRRGDVAVGEREPEVSGTLVRAEVDVDDAKDLSQVFAEYTTDFDFDRTRAVVRLFEIGVEFVSRSQAKRLVRGLERFREVVLDFSGVRIVGQGFADEVFRVWAMEHPEVNLLPVDMIEPIAFMVERAIHRRRVEEDPPS